MNAMNGADCGSAIAFRILQESLVVLNGVRQKYIREEVLLKDLNQTLVLMAKLARFWTWTPESDRPLVPRVNNHEVLSGCSMCSFQ